MPLGEENIRYHIDRNEKLKSIRAAYQSVWDDIARFIVPTRVQASEGSKKTFELYDATAIHSNKILAASMHGTLTPSSMLWSTFKLRDDRLNTLREVMDWLEICEERMWLARHQSNYNGAIHELYIDYPAFGQGCLLIEERHIGKPGFNGFLYKCFPNYQYCTARNSEGIVDTIYREFELSARAAADRWKGGVGEKIQQSLEKDPDRKFEFVHCVLPNENGKGKPWVSYYISKDDKKLVSEGGYYEFPYIVPAWYIVSGEEYGSGIGSDALPDIKTLNKAKEYDLKGWAKDIDPATFETDQGVLGTLDLTPGGRNVARDKNSIWTLDRKARYDVTQIKMEDLRQSIRQMFFSDQLKLQEGPEMTATEVHVRYELMQRLLGPSIGRYETEGLNPQIKREFNMMMRASSGRFPTLPPPPPVLAGMSAEELDIVYEGPLARAQRMGEASAIRRFFTVGVELSQVKQDVLDVADIDEGYRTIGEIEGVPSRVMRSEEEIRAIREKRAEAQRAEMEKQNLERLAAGIKDITPAAKALMEGGKA